MSKLGLIIKNEYKTDVMAKSFWISTFVIPVLFIGFGAVMGFLAANSETTNSINESIMPVGDKEPSIREAFAVLAGTFSYMFVIMYGAMIFQKVKTEKVNRIVEIIATCVPGRTMITAKIISVALVGLTQIMLWCALIGIAVFGLLMVFPIDISWKEILTPDTAVAAALCVLYFIGGYIFFGSLYAAMGAMTDKNNENQEYMAVLTFVLFISLYLGLYAADNSNAALTQALAYFPFTSPTVGSMAAIGKPLPWWQTLISLIILALSSIGAMALAGKIYTSALLLKGKRFTPRDIITFLKAR